MYMTPHLSPTWLNVVDECFQKRPRHDLQLDEGRLSFCVEGDTWFLDEIGEEFLKEVQLAQWSARFHEIQPNSDHQAWKEGGSAGEVVLVVPLLSRGTIEFKHGFTAPKKPYYFRGDAVHRGCANTLATPVHAIHYTCSS